MKKILMIAFHYPPFRGGSGIHRTLKFSRYLPDHGWQPIILTAHPRAYPQSGPDQLSDIPADVLVRRAFALDAARHLSLHGAYWKWVALPDRWASWWLGAVPAGLRLLRKHRPNVIWSTYPIATAHVIGLTLHRVTGIPWVADFRDSMTEEGYPHEILTRRSYLWIERQAVRYSARLIFTADSTREMYLKRYPELGPERCAVIPNGYDEEDFTDLVFWGPPEKIRNRPIRLLHSGLLYPEERDPTPFFRALSRLQSEGRLTAQDLRVDMRAPGSEGYYSTIIQELNIAPLVHLLPGLPYRQALQDCADADALLLFQAASCNHQIPAKIYEYLRLQKPILALTDDQGDTAALLRETGGATIVDLTDEQAIFLTVPRFLSLVGNNAHPLPASQKVQCYARSHQALHLAQRLSQLINSERES